MREKYNAFISYSHRDSEWARWVQRSLENYRVPKTLAVELGIPRKLGKVFRDREELSTGQNLGDHLTAALDNSQNLIVICSPNSKASPWVAKEIDYFKALGRGDRIFCLLVEGGADALAESLLTDVEGNPLEPLAADPRDEGDGKRLAKLKLIAGILDTNLDQLAQRERARRQKLFLGYAGLANVFLIAVGAALYFEQARQNEAEQKALERELGIQNVATMTEFVERTRQYYDQEVNAFVSEQFSGYLERLQNDDLETHQKVSKAKALRVLGEASYFLGEIDKSLAAYGESRELYHAAASELSEDLELAIQAAFADFYVGITYFYEGKYVEARQPIRQYAATIEALYQDNPDDSLLIQESVNAPIALLTLLIRESTSLTNELRAAIDKVSKAVSLAIDVSPTDPQILYAAQGGMHWAATAHMKSCEVLNALPYRERAVDYARQVIELDPRNRDYKIDLANVLFANAQMYLLNSTPREALQQYVEALSMQTDLLIEDAKNEYLASRKEQTLTELLATLTFHPEMASELAPEDYIKTVSLERSIGLSSTLDMYLMVRGTANNDPELVQRALDSLGNTRDNEDSSNQRVQLVVTLKRLAERALDTIFETKLVAASGDEADSCNARLITWANYELAGNYELADAALAKAQALGLSGMALGFYSDLMKAKREVR